MKTSSLIFLPLIVITGCVDEGTTSKEVREGAREAVEAPADYVGANVRAKNQAQVTSAKSSVENAVRMFQATEGRYPRELEELVREDYLGSLPDLPSGASYNYQASTGQVTIEGY